MTTLARKTTPAGSGGRRTRVLLVTLAGVLLTTALLALLVLAIELGVDTPTAGKDAGPAYVAAADRAALRERGAYLARAGHCMGCHTVAGGPAYAGGRAVTTPFGNIYASNITPDRATGIGAWTADDFWRALHHGRRKDGAFLYPAFPYPNYTRVTRADADALYAHLQALPPVAQVNREPELRFPYNQRWLLAYWRALYFTPGEYQPDARQSVQWNRGAYLVQGLGHCSACHTERNALGASIVKRDLAGAVIPRLNWYASPLNGDAATGLGSWDAADLALLLRHGVSLRAAVAGPMAEVVRGSLQYLSVDDVDAMVSYLKATSHGPVEPALPPRPPTDGAQVLARGARLYEQSCASCHGDDGRGQPPAYPPLAGHPGRAAGPPLNAIRLVLYGGFPPSTQGNPRPYGMPPFGAALADEDIAAVLSFVRTSWGNQGGFVSPRDVMRARGVPGE